MIRILNLNILFIEFVLINIFFVCKLIIYICWFILCFKLCDLFLIIFIIYFEGGVGLKMLFNYMEVDVRVFLDMV